MTKPPPCLTPYRPPSTSSVSSFGVALRANVFGFAVAEIDYVKPWQRDRGWLWQFALRPGF